MGRSFGVDVPATAAKVSVRTSMANNFFIEFLLGIGGLQ
jgi:hypothetical protein